MDLLDALLRWDQAGPVAILFFIVAALTWLTRWLLLRLIGAMETRILEVIADKDAQIKRGHDLTDKMTDEIGLTLKQILDALRDRDRDQSRKIGGSR